MRFRPPAAASSASSQLASRKCVQDWRIDDVIRMFRDMRQPDQWLRQPVLMVDIAKAEAALDAEAVAVGRAVPPLGDHDALVLHAVGHLASHAAIRTERIDLAVGPYRAHTLLADEARGHQRTGGQACTHSPQATQVESPMGSSKSKTIFEPALR